VVNKGSMKDLLALHGIGKKRAEAIIDNRPFHRVPWCSVLLVRGL